MNRLMDWVRLIGDIAQSPGGVALLVLSVFIGWESGILPSTSRETAKNLEAHRARSEVVTQNRIDIDHQLEVTLARLTSEIARQNRWNQIRACAEIRDVRLQDRCLSE